ncbi:MAG: ABC transporter permease [Desulfobacterales bacterium]
MNGRCVRELVRKEFLQLFRDRRNRPLLIVAPLLQLILFGYVVTTDVRETRFAVVDESRTPLSRSLVEAFAASPAFRPEPLAADARGLGESLLRRRIDLGIHIPPDFAARLTGGRKAEIQLLLDGALSHLASQRAAAAQAVIDDWNRRASPRNLTSRRPAGGPIEARIRTWYNPNLESRPYFVPGIVAFLVMLLSLLFTSLAVVREKEAGTMEQLIVTPLRPAEFLLGKTIPFFLIAQAQMLLVIGFARLWFAVPFAGSAAFLFAASALFLLCTLGVGLWISTASRTQPQAVLTTFLFILPFFLLSGFVFPIERMPPLVQAATRLNPLAHFLVVVRGVFLKGVGPSVLWPECLALAAIGTVVFGAALLRFRKRLD